MDDGADLSPDLKEARKWRSIAFFVIALLLAAIAVAVEFSTKGLKDTASVLTGILVNFASSLLGFLVAARFMRSRPSEADRLITSNRIQNDVNGSLKPIADAISAIQVGISSRPSKQTDEIEAKVLGEISKLAAVIRDQSRHRILEQIPWSALLAEASEIDFVVQGWDRWVDDNESLIKDLFRRGGKFRLYIYDPQSDKNSYARALMAERLQKTPNDVTVEINGTTSKLKAIRDELPPEERSLGPLTIFQTTRFNWYFAARIKGKRYQGGGSGRDVIVFSVYSHTRQKVAKMPAIMLYPDENEEMALWFQKELDHLAESSLF